MCTDGHLFYDIQEKKKKEVESEEASGKNLSLKCTDLGNFITVRSTKEALTHTHTYILSTLNTKPTLTVNDTGASTGTTVRTPLTNLAMWMTKGAK